MQLKDIHFKCPVELTNHFFQFVDIEDEISESVLTQIENELGTQLKIIYERM